MEKKLEDEVLPISKLVVIVANQCELRSLHPIRSHLHRPTPTSHPSLYQMDSMYLVEKGIRSVKPYYFEYKTPFKPRWANLTVKQVLCKELGQLESVVDQSIDRGHIYVTENNGKAGGPVAVKHEHVKNHLLQLHDIICNKQHMHEPSVVWNQKCGLEIGGSEVGNMGIGSLGNSDLGIENLGFGRYGSNKQTFKTLESGLCILFENDQLIVVSKPGGVATHPSGIYRLNTLTEIVKHEMGYEVWPCHRLDKATLGVLVLAKSKEMCKRMMEIMKAKEESTEKHYVARVKGEFPFTKTLHYTCPVFTVNSASEGYVNVANSAQVSTESTTIFEKVGYFPKLDESIVKCQPISGKMHQIRVHLRNLGYPICNDPLYNPVTETNTNKNEIEMRIYEQIFTRWPSLRLGQNHLVPPTIDVSSMILDKIRLEISQMAEMRKAREEEAQMTLCEECGRHIYDNQPDLGIYLHALRLRNHGDPDFEFATNYPRWASSES